MITFEGTGPLATLKRSAALFKERWAGQMAGNVAIGGIVGLLGVLPAIALIAGGACSGRRTDGDGSRAGAVLIAIGVVLLRRSGC